MADRPKWKVDAELEKRAAQLAVEVARKQLAAEVARALLAEATSISDKKNKILAIAEKLATIWQIEDTDDDTIDKRLLELVPRLEAARAGTQIGNYCIECLGYADAGAKVCINCPGRTIDAYFEVIEEDTGAAAAGSVAAHGTDGTDGTYAQLPPRIVPEEVSGAAAAAHDAHDTDDASSEDEDESKGPDAKLGGYRDDNAGYRPRNGLYSVPAVPAVPSLRYAESHRFPGPFPVLLL